MKSAPRRRLPQRSTSESASIAHDDAHYRRLGYLRVVVIIVAALAVFFAAPWWMPRTWYRALLYPNHKPNALARAMNSLGAWTSSRGIGPSLMITLETIGRKTGRTLAVPMVVAELGGERYLVSMLGENSAWIHNMRAANNEAVLRFGTPERVRLLEVPVAERPLILRAYLKRAPGARPHFDINLDAPLDDFARIAPRYPVFRVVSLHEPAR
jgi:hypothetical protein